MMKLAILVWIILLMLAACCCWLSIPPAPLPGIRIVEVPNISMRSFVNASTTAVAGVYVNPQFLKALHALEQRAKAKSLGEPKTVVGRSSFYFGQVNRIYSEVKFTFIITNR